MTRTHLAHGTGSRCGRGAVVDTITHSTPERIVTCLACLRLSRGARIQAAVVLAAEPPPFVPSGPYASPRAASNLDTPGRRIIARSIAGDEPDEHGRWSSVREALGAVATARDEGVPLASTSSPSRFGRGKVSGGGTVRHSIATQLRCIEAEAALERSIRDVRVNRLLRVEARYVRAIASLVLLGRRTEHRIPGRKSYRRDREPVPMDDVIAAVHSMGGPTLKGAQVRLAARSIERAVAEVLYAKGLVVRSAVTRGGRMIGKEGSDMAAPHGYDVDGWKEIGALVGRGEDTARKLARRREDPLPVRWYLGRAVAKRADIESWIGRQTATDAA